ncbi:hypothetical protein B296_00041492 [Ensete ventricosum]|uniref:Terpene synthase N-terminal domain-containing protein n=1 Tax=Ensete ventricosum TaxID=4639 RepID=A0A426XJX8_ENSVE|nr:hypothetical protein B296_00041492 [Ensete ventricosum]
MEEEQCAVRINKLEERVVKLIQEEKELEDQLQLIDHLQQLGVAYHFKDDIKDALGSIHGSLEDKSMLLKHNLHATALLFRLLRENGFDVSEGGSSFLHSRFKDGKGHLKACLQHQTKGMLSLYEASYLEKEGELVLSQAMDFTTKHLKKLMEQGSLEPPLREQVASALELPLHWRMHRLHARWDINAIDKFPEYMKMCFLAVFNLANNAAYRIMKEKNAELQRGDVAKALQCCMHERDVSESAAREHVGDLIRANWRALNGNHPSNCFTTVASNTPLVSQFMYGNGDGYGIPDGETKNQVMALLIEPIMF